MKEKMRKIMKNLLVLMFLAMLLLPAPSHGIEFVSNGNFEQGFYYDNKDTVPRGWTKLETFPEGCQDECEDSKISLLDDNGPSALYGNSINFCRTNGGQSGDWTAIEQGLDIFPAYYSVLELTIDIMAISHNLCGGGMTGAWEYPITVVIQYIDSEDNSKNLQIGWYADTNNSCDATDEWKWWPNSNRWARSQKIDKDTWYNETIDLLDSNLDIVHITSIRVGGAGRNFEGRVDNVSITGVPVIDIKPGSCPNSINLKSRGVLPVAILTTENLDALYVDEGTVKLGYSVEFVNTADPIRSTEEDVDNDGDLDLLLFFRIPELVENGVLDKHSTEAFLTGNMDVFSGSIVIFGKDSVRIVPPSKSHGPSGGPPWYQTGCGGPPWYQTGCGGPPWFQTGTGGPGPSCTTPASSGVPSVGPQWYRTGTGGPSWFQTGTGGPWWWEAMNGVPSVGPKWYQTGTGGPNWFQTSLGGPWWWKAANNVPSVGPQWYQTGVGGPNWFQTGTGGPWWTSLLP